LIVGTSGTPKLVVPALEAPRVNAGDIEVVAWAETDDPFALIAGALGGARRVAVGDQTRAANLLAIQAMLPDVIWERASDLTARLRVRKEPEEVELLRQLHMRWTGF
jgi:Xaa-Pro aminopeptidase